ncbi:MAG: hypothetical protein II628_01595 [Lachnospiraceae bacterium]|nr:hypothetical protein [Lachnospiraceae bacterium]
MLFEKHVTDLRMALLPVMVTLFYGVFMMVLNGLGKFEGPYPFFRVRHQSVKSTALWTAALAAIILVLSLGITALSACL